MGLDDSQKLKVREWIESGLDLSEIQSKLQEELGVTTWETCLAPLSFASYAYDDFHLLMPLFICRKWEGYPQAQEGQTLKWVKANSLRDYPMPPADEPLIPALMDIL